MAAETQYTANTGFASISTGTNSLTGSGSTLLLTAALNGTLVKSINFKATGASTAEGMLRVFVYDGSSYNLIKEVHVHPVTQAATTPTFEYKWDCDLQLKATYKLYVSTENSNNFMVTAEGLDWSYFASSVRPESTNFTANTKCTVISAANTSLTASSDAIFTAASSPSKGARIESITINAQVTTITSMIRIFVVGGGTTALFKEIPVDSVTVSANEPAFSVKVPMNGYNLMAGYALHANIQDSKAFAFTVEANDWNYPSASSSTNLTPASGTAVTSEELLHSLSVPAGLFTTGDVIRVYADLILAGSGNKTFRIYTNSTNSLSGATKLATVIYTTETSASLMRLFPVISATSFGAFGGATQNVQTQYASNAGTTSNITVATAASAFYILISGQKATSGDTDTVQWSMYCKENV